MVVSYGIWMPQEIYSGSIKCGPSILRLVISEGPNSTIEYGLPDP